ncbi:MAG: DUF904 domain-containing protein [Herminiimonas sp.]|nr:DUF904 domain-containing protein [Herminiimonas sp.]
MISDFELLALKVTELAELAHALRRESTELRAQVAALDTQNGELAQRMRKAHDRVAALLDQLPAAQHEVADAADAVQQEPA